MDLNVSKVVIVKVSPKQKVVQERLKADEKFEKEIAGCPSKRKLKEIADDQAKPTPLEEKGLALLHSCLTIMNLAGAKFLIVTTYGNDAKPYQNNEEVGLSTSISFTKMPVSQSDMETVGGAIKALSVGGLLEVEIIFKL